ncbi:ABC transporter ATP-binding protein [Cohnella lubricantis]|uniref:ABC transporter ATP-binding protein n=1 Tax=Cohnella lubricantis TaxID=2163172 RepID=A0A841T9Y7_9BACL|nr:ABC transporter ATP-binding protein [Cohnella lubricantis]MBB6676859.1 ABC transporter ATP-binding protein [Cohnella lubricantis]MBP2119439.1 ATP-binding cassette subfamily B protein [Cohnella lubricantis]
MAAKMESRLTAYGTAARLREKAGLTDVLAQWSTPLSETGVSEPRTLVLRKHSLDVQGPNGELLRSIPRSLSSGAAVRETGGGAWLELSLTDGTKIRLAMALLSGIRELTAIAERIGQWAKEASDSDGESANGSAEPASDAGQAEAGAARPAGRSLRTAMSKRLRVLSGLLRYAAPYRKPLMLSGAALLIGVGLEALPPYLMKLMIDGGVLGSSQARFAGLIGMLLAVYVLQAAFQVLRSSISIRIGNRMISRIREDMFDKLMRLSVRYYEHRASAPFIGRIQYDTSSVQSFLSEGLPQLLAQLVMTGTVFAVLLLIDWRLTLWVLCAVPLCGLAAALLWPKMRSLMNRTWNVQFLLQKYIGDALQGVRVIKAFHREEEEKARFGYWNESAVARVIEQQRWSQWLQPGFNLAVSGGIALVWLVIGRQVIRGTASLGTLVAFTTYLSMFIGQLRWNLSLVGQANTSIASADRIFELLNTQEELPEPAKPVPLADARGEIAVDRVSFGYEKGRSVLEDFSLRIRPGEKIGITGRSGAGKSTLLQLLGRFYDPDGGSIRIDGIDLRTLATADLRRHIGIVFQETFLFDGTIAQNIAYGRSGASPMEIMEAARLARAHTFIERLPYGYDTLVGERGVRLSGGEKQRIAIARALLLNPPILLLDEATSSVDMETERDIQSALETLSEGRTTIAIAHRLSTLRNADRIIVLDRGTIVESGTHDELRARNGLYRQLLEAREEARELEEAVP